MKNQKKKWKLLRNDTSLKLDKMEILGYYDNIKDVPIIKNTILILTNNYENRKIYTIKKRYLK